MLPGQENSSLFFIISDSVENFLIIEGFLLQVSLHFVGDGPEKGKIDDLRDSCAQINDCDIIRRVDIRPKESFDPLELVESSKRFLPGVENFEASDDFGRIRKPHLENFVRSVGNQRGCGAWHVGQTPPLGDGPRQVERLLFVELLVVFEAG